MERRRIDGIQPFAQLAEGSTTTVYKGYQERLDRFVLLKVLRPALARDEELAERFEEEARLVAQIQHPNVVTIHDYGRTDDRRTYLATEFVEGTDLRALLEDHGALPPALAAFALHEATAGLEAAHERDILHRDLKPANVLFAADGQVKITDFGMASTARRGACEGAQLRGTPPYLAPEYVSGEAPSEAGDLFALGAVLYEMLTARRAFTGPSTGDVLDAVRHQDPLPVLDRRAAPPAALRAIAAKLLAKDPEARYQNAGALLEDLNAFLRDQDTPPTAAELAAFMEDPAAYRESARVSSPAGTSDPVDNAAAPTEGGAWSLPALGDVSPPRLAGYALLAALLLGSVVLSIVLYASGGDHEAGPPAEQPDRQATPAGSTGEVSPPRDTLVAQRADSATAIPAGTTATLPPRRREPPERASAEPRDAAPAPQKGALKLRVSPWAEVLVDGASVGKTPLPPIKLAAGEHELVFKNEHFPRDVRRKVRVVAGENRTMKIVLADYVGRVSVKVEPYAEVFVDGTSRGVRDMSAQKGAFIMPPGHHELRLEHPKLGAYTKRIDVEAGEVQNLTFNLREIKKIN